MNISRVSAFALLNLSLMTLSAFAAPTITKINLASAITSPTVITGSSFGVFGGEIASWDDFETQPVNTNPYGLTPIKGATWTTIYDYKGQGITVNAEKSVSGSKSMKVDWSIDPDTGIHAFGWANKGPYTQLYITYWRWMQGNYDGKVTGANHKQFYLYGNNAGLPQMIAFMEAGETDGRWGVNGNYDATPLGLPYNEKMNISSEDWRWSTTTNKFQRWEFFVKLNNPVSSKNGVIQVRVNGKLGVDNRNYPAANVNGQFTDFRLGHMAHQFTDSAKAWFDDVYVSSTQARVEVCNASTYEACTIKHIQYVDPAKWTDTQIELKLRNMSAFKGSSAYLYVVDKDGNVSAGTKLNAPMMTGN